MLLLDFLMQSVLLDKLQNWQKRNKEQVKAFNDVVNQSTIEQIDPTKPKTNYESKEAEYDAIKKIYNSLDAEGKELYVDLRKEVLSLTSH